MKKAYKIVFLGNSSVGKTTLINQYIYNKAQAPTPTIGIDFLSTTFEINGKPVRLQVWDTAGQERFQSIIGNYTRNIFIAVIVYSVDDKLSFERIKMWVNEFVYSHNAKEDVHLLIVANKRDLKTENFDPEFKESKNLSKEIGAKFVTASALDKTGIDDMVNAINDFIIEDLETNDEDDEKEEMNALKAIPRKRNCC